MPKHSNFSTVLSNSSFLVCASTLPRQNDGVRTRTKVAFCTTDLLRAPALLLPQSSLQETGLLERLGTLRSGHARLPYVGAKPPELPQRRGACPHIHTAQREMEPPRPSSGSSWTVGLTSGRTEKSCSPGSPGGLVGSSPARNGSIGCTFATPCRRPALAVEGFHPTCSLTSTPGGPSCPSRYCACSKGKAWRTQ